MAKGKSIKSYSQAEVRDAVSSLIQSAQPKSTSSKTQTTASSNQAQTATQSQPQKKRTTIAQVINNKQQQTGGQFYGTQNQQPQKQSIYSKPEEKKADLQEKRQQNFYSGGKKEGLDEWDRAEKAQKEHRQKAENYDAQIEQLRQEGQNRSQIWVDGVYMGEDKQAADSYSKRIAKLQKKADAEWKAAGGRDQTVKDRAVNLLTGAGQGWVGPKAKFYGSAMEDLALLNEKLGSNTSDYAGWATDELSAAQIGQENDPQKRAQQLAETRQMQEFGRQWNEQGAERTEKAKEGLGFVGGAAVDLATNYTQAGLDKIPGLLLGPAGSMLSLFTRSAGAGMLEAEANGATREQAKAYGLTVGAIEAATEKMFGGLARVYGKGSADDLVESVVRKLAKTRQGRQVLLFGADVVGEAIEEVASNRANPFAKAIYDNGESIKKTYTTWEGFKESVSEDLYSALIGGLMGGLGGASKVRSGDYSRTATKMDLQDAIDEINAQEQATVNPGARNLQIFLSPALDETGTPSGDQDVVAMTGLKGNAKNYLNAKLTGEKGGPILGDILNPELVARMPEGARMAAQAIASSEGAEQATQNVLNYISDIVLGKENGKPLQWDDAQSDAATGYVLATLATKFQGGLEVAPKNQMNIAREAIEFAQKGMTLEDAIDIANETAQKEVTATPAPPVTEAPAPVQTVKPEQDSTGTAWTGDWDSWVEAALSGGALSDTDINTIYSRPEARRAFEERKGSLEGLSEEEAKSRIGMAAGTMTRVVTQDQAQETPTEAVEGVSSAGSTNTQENAENAEKGGYNSPESQAEMKPDTPRAKAGSGTVSFDGAVLDGKEYAAVNKGSLTTTQKNQIAALETLAKTTGVNITFFQSKMDEEGRFLGANGAYKDGTLYLDVNAGLNKIRADGTTAGEIAIVRTAAHELTHFVQDFNETDYNDMKAYIVDALVKETGAKGLDELIDLKIKRAKGGISRAQALDEVIADGCEMMLKNSKVVEELATENMTLARRIGRWIRSWNRKLSAAFEGVDVHNKEARILMKEADKLQKMWDSALKKAMKAQGLNPKTELYENGAVQTAIDTLSDTKGADGKAQMQVRAFEHDEESYRKMLKKAKWSDEKIDDLFNMLDEVTGTINEHLEALDYETDADIDDRVFAPVKKNSDKLYKVSQDFSTLCRKRILQGIIVGELSAIEGRGLTKEEGIAVRDALMTMQEEYKEIEVACALCYVESARMRSQAAINRFLDDREAAMQDFYAKKFAKKEIDKADAAIRKTIAEHAKKGTLAEIGLEGIEVDEDGNIRGRGGDDTFYDVTDKKAATLDDLPPKVKAKIQEATKAARAEYKMTDEQKAVVDEANSLPVDMFTTAKGIETLKKDHPDVWGAYNQMVSAASKSKGIESDTWWRAGDSKKISKKLIEQMNKENGLRTQSWSDFQVKHLMDYIAATIELSTRGAKQHAYTKVLDYVDLMGDTGVMINMSLIPTREYKGKLEYDPVEGIDYEKAKKMREKFPETAGTICIGMNTEQIHQLLEDDTIDYVIPYHISGMSAETRQMMHIPAWENFQDWQNEKKVSRKKAQENAERFGVTLLPTTDKNWHKEPKFSDWFDLEQARKDIEKYGKYGENAKQYGKNVKKGEYGVMTGGYLAMQDAADRYKKLCAERGLVPKFSYGDVEGTSADYSSDPNYWKLLIDRKMVNNKTGEIIEQKPIQPNFSRDTINRILNEEIERHGRVATQQAKATDRVVDLWKKGKLKGGMGSEEIAKAVNDQGEAMEATSMAMAADEAQQSDGKADVSPYEEAISSAKRKAARFSDRESYNEAADEAHNAWAPMFYSKMDQTIDKQMPNKMGADQVVKWLAGKGVKKEEIRWSGIEQFLEGKKTVTKAELQDFMKGNEVNIQTKTLGDQRNLEGKTLLSGEAGVFNSVQDALDRTAEYAKEIDGVYADLPTYWWEDDEVAFGVPDSETGELVELFRCRPVGGEGSTGKTHWAQYTLRGGFNYREILFQMQGLDYYNRASRTHWEDDAPGTIAHARVQDMVTTDGKKVLFVEEIQSDLHNEGASSGFTNNDLEEYRALSNKSELLNEQEHKRYQELRRKLMPLYDEYHESRRNNMVTGDQLLELAPKVSKRFTDYVYENFAELSKSYDRNILRDVFSSTPDQLYAWMFGEEGREPFYGDKNVREAAEEILDSILTPEEWETIKKGRENRERFEKVREPFRKQRRWVHDASAPDVPFAGSADTYQEYVMKHLLRLAAEGDYDAIGWTTAEQQGRRWDMRYVEKDGKPGPYKIEYDQNLPSFMKKYTKQWDGKVGALQLESPFDFEWGPEGAPATEVWGVELTDDMKNDVLYVGQPMFQERDLEEEYEPQQPKTPAPETPKGPQPSYKPSETAEILAEASKTKSRAPRKVLSEGTGKVKISQFYSNTQTKTGVINLIDKSGGKYNVKSEAESLANAAERLKKDYKGMIKYLVNAEAWSGEMADAAWIVEEELLKDFARTGDRTALDKWERIQSAKRRESARAVQATAKMSRPGAAVVIRGIAQELEAARAANEEAKKAGKTENIIPEEVLQRAETKANEIANKMLNLEIEIDDRIDAGMGEAEAKELSKEAYLDLIDEINAFRHVGLIQDAGVNAEIRNNVKDLNTKFRKRLSEEGMEYIQRFAACDAAGITEDIHYKGKKDFLKRLNTWQKLAQLTGTGTWGRNGVGNGSFGLVDVIANNSIFTRLADAMLSKKTGKRSTGFEWGVIDDSARDAARHALNRSILEVAANIDLADNGQTKYDMSRNRAYDPDGKAFERMVSRWEQWNGYMLQSSDAWFKGMAEGSAAQAIRAANNWDKDNLTDTERSRLTEEEAKKLTKERQKELDETTKQIAEYRTFQNDGWAADKANKLRDALNKAGHAPIKYFTGKDWQKGQFGLGTALMPYTKVPTNLGVKALEFSPAGAAKGLLEMLKVANDPKATMAQQNQAVTDFGRGMTGTVLIAVLAKAMKNWKWFKDWEAEEDKDVKAQNKAEGKSGIQINLSLLQRGLEGDKDPTWKNGDNVVDISSMEPVNQLFTTASLIAEGMTARQALFTSAKDNLMGIPSLQALQNIENNIKYTDTPEDGWQTLLTTAASTAGSVAGGMLPAPLRHAGTAADPYARDTSGKNALERAWNQTISSVPGARKTLPVKTDAFGNEVKAGGVGTRIANQYLPFKHNQVNQSAASREIERLREATGETLVPSRTGPKTVQYGKTKVELDPEERNKYKNESGQEYQKAINSLMKSPVYNLVDDDTKAAMIAELESYAKDSAKEDLAKKNNIKYESKYNEFDDLDKPAVVIGTKAGFNDAKNNEDWKAMDNILKAVSKGGVSESDREFLEDEVQTFWKMLDMAEQGVSSKKVHQFDQDVKAIYTAEHRTDSNGSDLLAAAAKGVREGKLTLKEADALMGRENRRNEKNIYEQLDYEMKKVGKTEEQVQQVWDMLQQFDDGEVSKSKIVSTAISGVPKREQQRIKNVITSWTKTRATAGKGRTSVYNAMRNASPDYTPEDVQKFWYIVDANGDGTLTKKEFNSALKKIPSEYRSEVKRSVYRDMGWK